MKLVEGQTLCSIMFNILHFDKDLSLTAKICVPTSCLSVHSIISQTVCRTRDYDNNGNTAPTNTAHAYRTVEIVFEEITYR
jgi:hypothetical protein